MKYKYVKLITGIVLLGCSTSGPLLAQDARVSQYHATPLLINPAQTGDFDGPARITGLYARVSNDKIFNQFFNLSADWKLDQQDKWALGVNYMRSGTSKMAISGDYAGLSLGRRFFLDKYKLQELRLGAQLSYLRGSVNESRPYDRLLDVGAFRYWQPDISTGNYKGTAEYLNLSLGAKYKIDLNRLKIETGFAAYNATNPNFNIMYNGILLKRYRVNVLSSIYYRTDAKNAFKFEHFSWKEGIYLRDYKKSRDTLGVHETTYSLTWYHYMQKKTFNFGVYSRSWQAVYGMAGLNLNENIGINLSYEVPVYKKYYNVSHFEVSLSLFPFARKKQTPNNDQVRAKLTALIPEGNDLCDLCPVKVERIIEPAPVPVVVPVAPAVVAPVQEVEEAPKLHFEKHSRVLYSDTIYYDFDKYNINAVASPKLNRIIAELKKEKELTLEVRSHTDLRGNYAYNEQLSKRRFISVKEYLQKAGIDTTRIKAGWYGKNQPINNCATCDDVLQHKNRRSELHLYGFDSIESERFTFGAAQVNKEEYLKRIKAFANLDLILPFGDHPAYTIKIGTEEAEDGKLLLLKTLNANVTAQKTANGKINYYFGAFDVKEGAEAILIALRKLGFQDAEIIALAKNN